MMMTRDWGVGSDQVPCLGLWISAEAQYGTINDHQDSSRAVCLICDVCEMLLVRPYGRRRPAAAPCFGRIWYLSQILSAKHTCTHPYH